MTRKNNYPIFVMILLLCGSVTCSESRNGKAINNVAYTIISFKETEYPISGLNEIVNGAWSLELNYSERIDINILVIAKERDWSSPVGPIFSNMELLGELEGSIVTGNIQKYNFTTCSSNIIASINGIKWCDSLVVTGSDSSTICLWRYFFTSTPEYYIFVIMKLPSKCIDRMLLEAPRYFNVDRKPAEWVQGGSESFTVNVRNGNIESQLVKQWYIETTQIVNDMKLK